MSAGVEEFFNKCHGQGGRFCSTGGRSHGVKGMRQVSIDKHAARDYPHPGTKVKVRKEGAVSRLMSKVAANAEKSASKTRAFREAEKRFVYAGLTQD